MGRSTLKEYLESLIAGAGQGLAGLINSGDPAGGRHDPLAVVDAAHIRLIDELRAAREPRDHIAVHSRRLYLPEVGGYHAEGCHKLRDVLIGGKTQCRGRCVQHIVLRGTQIVRQHTPGMLRHP